MMKAYGSCLALLLCASQSACSEAECATPDYTRAECRVLSENLFARTRSSHRVEVRFQHPDATNDSAWEALGVVRERGSLIEARVASLGSFALTLRGPTEDPAPAVDVRLTNVHPDAILRVGPLGKEVIVNAPPDRTERNLRVEVPPGEVIFIRGELPCPEVFRLIALADMQTNPTEFERIVERIQQELVDARAAGELLAGAVMSGDLTESSTEIEFAQFSAKLDPSSVPFALTAGNHDIYDSMLPYYNQNFGPGNYAFNVCRARIAMLDSGSGTIANSVMGRLPELFQAAGADFQITAMHHPPYAHLTSAGWTSEEDAMTMLGEFAFQGGDLVLAGHAHLLREYRDIPVGGASIREVIAGTAGASQGAGQPIYGYVRLRFTDEIDACFVEVPPPGALPTKDEELPMKRCD